MIELNFGEYLSEIFVSEPDWAPYRYVSFEAAGMVNGAPKLVHFWYDGEETAIEEILENLNKAVNVVYVRSSQP